MLICMQQLAENEFSLGERDWGMLGPDRTMRCYISCWSSDSSWESLRRCSVGCWLGRGTSRSAKGACREKCVHVMVLLTDPVQCPLLETWSAFIWRVILLLKDSSKEEMGREVAMDLINYINPTGEKGFNPWSWTHLWLCHSCLHVLLTSRGKVKDAMKPWFLKRGLKKSTIKIFF